MKLKKGVSEAELMELTAPMFYLLGAMVLHCHDNNLPLVITSVKEKIGQRVSSTHRQGRAVDISVRGWSKKEIELTVKKFNTKYEKIAAISASDNEPRAAIFHNVSLGDHIHLQVKPVNNK